jgi:hypothetical protein
MAGAFDCKVAIRTMKKDSLPNPLRSGDMLPPRPRLSNPERTTMKASYGLLIPGALLLALSACDTTVPVDTATVPGDSAGSAGPSYCETVPTNPDDMEQWNELCSPDGRR